LLDWVGPILVAPSGIDARTDCSAPVKFCEDSRTPSRRTPVVEVERIQLAAGAFVSGQNLKCFLMSAVARTRNSSTNIAAVHFAPACIPPATVDGEN